MSLYYLNNCDDCIISDLDILMENQKYNQVITCTSKYLKKFPNNQKIRIIRAESYIKLFKYDNAIDDLKYNAFLGNDESLGKLYMLYYFLNDYDEALKLLPIVKQKKCIDERSEVISEIIIKRKLKIIFSLKGNSKYTYVKSQISNYDVLKALEHITHHMYNKDDQNKRAFYFHKNINLNYLFSIVRKNLQNYNKANTLDSLDIYYFYIKDIGYNYANEKNCNLLKVVVIPNTNKVITMFPVEDFYSDYSYKLNLNYGKLFNTGHQKVKKISKFDINV